MFKMNKWGKDVNWLMLVNVLFKLKRFYLEEDDCDGFFYCLV